MSQHLGNAKVGVFWIHNGIIFGQAFSASEIHATSLGIIDASIDHATLWDSCLFERVELKELINLEYFQTPRGRVVFNTKSRAAQIYTCTELLSKSNRLLVRNFFDLTRTKVRWIVDEHYALNPPSFKIEKSS